MAKKAKTKKVVINRRYGGFGLSHEGIMYYAKLKGIKLYWWVDEISKKVYGDEAKTKGLRHYSTIPIKDQADYHKKVEKNPDENFYWSVRDIKRDDDILVKTVETLGKKANGRFACLKVIAIPAAANWQIEEYDGLEWIAEAHRTWR